MKCFVCDRDFKSERGFINHFNKKHLDEIEPKDYYDKYIGKIGECVQCGGKTEFISILKGYRETCSYRCSYVRTSIEKYGVEHPTKNVAKKKSMVEKIKKTKLQRYGSENYNNFDKQRKTIEGIKNFYEVRNKKLSKTKLEKYGDKNYNNIEKYRKTMLEKYGVEHNSKNTETIKKRLRTFRKNHYETFLSLLKLKKIKPLFSIEEYVDNAETKSELRLECECGNIFKSSELITQHIFCDRCKKMPYSKKEKMLADEIVSSLGTETEIKFNHLFIDEESRRRFELDIFIPSLNMGIEFNGEYWHGELFKDKYYHRDKYLFFKDRNINLIQVSEYDWDNKRDIVLSIIKNRLGIIERKIFARKCLFRELNSKEYRLFLENNHINGSVNSEIRFGLEYNGEIVSVMGFGKNRFSKDDNLELHRFCNKLDTSVVGGFTKLLSKLSDKREIISFCDLNYFSGCGYEKAGFELIEVTEPNYDYFDRRIKVSRYQAQKHRLGKLLENYDPNKTEHKNMIDNGFFRVYNSGNLKLILEKN